MALPSPTLTDDERALLECLGECERTTPPYSLLLHDACKACSIDEVRLHAIVWSLRDPRRFTHALAIVDASFRPPLVRLTPSGLRALSGHIPVQPLLRDELSSRQTGAPDAPGTSSQ